jgi:hypothetical protein
MSGTESAVVSRMRDLNAEPVEWLWPQRLAAGKLALLDGDPSQGKSLISLDIASRFTVAADLPDGYKPAQPIAVLLIGAEDEVTDTVLPRLQSAGADPDRVHFFHGCGDGRPGARLPTFPDDCPMLKQIIHDTEARLVVVDPLMAFFANHLCAVNDQMVRRALGPLARVAEATRAAILLVRHLNKGGTGQRAIYRGSGSIAIVAAARTAFLIGRDPEDPETRLLACTKNNLMAPPPTLGFRIEPNPHGQPVIVWTGVVDVTADEVVLAARRRPGEALAQATTFLQEFLTSGPASREEVLRRARGSGIADRTLIRAKGVLEVVSGQSYRKGQNVWYWYLPEDAGKYTNDNWDDPRHRQLLAGQREMQRFIETINQQ